MHFPLLAMGLGPQLCPTCGQAPLSAMQKAVGYVTVMGSFKLLGAIALLAGLCFIFWGVIKNLLASEGLIELLLWGGGAGSLILASRLTKDMQTFTLLPAAGLIAGGYLYSGYIRNKKTQPTIIAISLAILWSAIALFFGSAPVGFMAVAALLTALGFSIIVEPLCTVIGFDDDDSLSRGTISGLLLIGAYTALRAFKLDFGPAVVFTSGALWLGGLAGFTGLLILSSRHYHDDGKLGNYAFLNLIAGVVFAGSILLGGYYDIRQLSTFGVVYLVLLAVEKVSDVKAKDAVTIGLQLIAIGGILFSAWRYMHAHMNELSRYIIGIQ